MKWDHRDEVVERKEQGCVVNIERGSVEEAEQIPFNFGTWVGELKVSAMWKRNTSAGEWIIDATLALTGKCLLAGVSFKLVVAMPVIRKTDMC